MLGPKRLRLKDLGVDDEAVNATLTELMVRFSGRKNIGLEAFLLPEDHPIISQYYRGMKMSGDALASSVCCDAAADQPKPAPTPKQPKQSKAQKTDAHDREFAQMGHEKAAVWTPKAEDLDLWPGLRAITERGFEILHHFNVEYPERSLRALDISQSLSRVKDPTAEALSQKDGSNRLAPT